MIKGQKSVRNGIEDFLCPFANMYITQGSMQKTGTHRGIYANDVRGASKGLREAYYAPCTCKCVRIYPENGQAMWQSTGKVRFANGRIDYATFMTVHDDSFDAKVGMVVPQGNQLGNMGTRGNATGVHCHIEVSQSADTSWTKNQYGIYHFNNEYDLDSCYFVDNTNIIYGMGGDWKTTGQVSVSSPQPSGSGKNYVNLPPNINSWSWYNIDASPVKKNSQGTLNPQKFGGLSYYVHEYRDGGTTAVIKGASGKMIKIYIKDTPAEITIDSYKYGLVN